MGELLLDAVTFLARRATATEPAPALLTEAGRLFTRFDEQDLDQYFGDHPRQGNTSEGGAFVFLPMVTKHRLLPVLNVAYDLDRDHVRLQVVVFIEAGIKKHGPRAFGYRYEPPEGAGRHDFWHAQPILELRLYDDTYRQLPGSKDHWRPADTPSFPLDADQAVDLLLCLMISLYGLQDAATMQANGFENRLAARLEQMRSRGT